MKQHTDNQTALYRRGDETRLVRIVPENAQPESFEVEGHTRNIIMRAFKVEKADMLGWLPQSGDTLEWSDKIYTVRKFGTGVFHLDVGNSNIVMRIFVTE